MNFGAEWKPGQLLLKPAAGSKLLSTVAVCSVYPFFGPSPSLG